MKRISKETILVTAMLLVSLSAWAESNGDTYIPDEKTMISKGLPPCYTELSAWNAANSQGDATTQTPPDWVTAKCAVQYEPPMRAFTGTRAQDYLQNN